VKLVVPLTEPPLRAGNEKLERGINVST
jgi:hypothetical protein